MRSSRDSSRSSRGRRVQRAVPKAELRARLERCPQAIELDRLDEMSREPPSGRARAILRLAVARQGDQAGVLESRMPDEASGELEAVHHRQADVSMATSGSNSSADAQPDGPSHAERTT